MILAPLQKLPRNVKDLSKLIVPKGIKKLLKVQKIANYGHTDHNCLLQPHTSHTPSVSLVVSGQQNVIPFLALSAFRYHLRDAWSRCHKEIYLSLTMQHSYKPL